MYFLFTVKVPNLEKSSRCNTYTYFNLKLIPILEKKKYTYSFNFGQLFFFKFDQLLSNVFATS